MTTHVRTAPLIYLIGASGAGKDTLLDAARAHFAGDAGIVFARRHITRPAGSIGEDHIPVDQAAFPALVQAGDFLFDWHGHDLHYGIHRRYGEVMAAGRVVVVNGSRGYLAEARRRCASLRPVVLRVDPEILGRRLLERGRETPPAVAERLRRARPLQAEVPADAAVIHNSGPLKLADAAFCRLLREARGGNALSAD